MRKTNLKTISVFVALLLCVAMTGMTARAQKPTSAKAKQSSGKSKAAPKASSGLDEDYPPLVIPKAKPPSRADAANRGQVAADEIDEPTGGGTPEANSAPATTPTTTPVTGAPPSSAPVNDAPKKAGVMRLCLVTPRTQMSAGDTAQAAEAVRNTFKSFFTGPTIETVIVAARLPSQAFEEAKQSGCEYVLYSSLTHKKGGSGGGLLGRALGDAANSAAWHIPGGGSTAGAVARTAAVTGINTAANLATSIKAKDEITLEYKLQATDGARLVSAKIEKAKAKADGEDVLTPLIEKAAEAVAAAMMKK